MKYTKLILASVMTLALLVPMVSAAPFWSDEWFIDKATTYVTTEYTEHEDLEYVGDVVSNWEMTFKPFVEPHKHVDLYAEYELDNYYDLGTVTWNGRVYWNGHCYTIDYVDVKPTQMKMLYQQSIYLSMTGPAFWDGEQWRSYDPICYQNDTTEPIEIHFTLYGYDKTYTVKPGYCLAIYTPYNTYF